MGASRLEGKESLAILCFPYKKAGVVRKLVLEGVVPKPSALVDSGTMLGVRGFSCAGTSVACGTHLMLGV